MHTMPKYLTYFGLACAGLIILIFLLDLALGWPFKKASLAMDVAFVFCAAVLAVISWFTLREQV
jgi:hypothetical protein